MLHSILAILVALVIAILGFTVITLAVQLIDRSKKSEFQVQLEIRSCVGCALREYENSLKESNPAEYDYLDTQKANERVWEYINNRLPNLQEV